MRWREADTSPRDDAPLEDSDAVVLYEGLAQGSRLLVHGRIPIPVAIALVFVIAL